MEEQKVWSNSKFFTKFLLVLAVIPWIGYISVGIINEDFLILSWMSPHTFFETFNNFFQREVGGPYWRPVVWTLDSLTKFFYQYNSIPYHITNIAIYSAICWLFYKLLQKLEFEEISARIGAFIFTVLPAHELSVAWIAGRTDTIMALFLLLSLHVFLRSEKKILLIISSAFLFMLSIMSKEPAYAAVLLPLLLLLKEDTNKSRIKPALYASIIAFALVSFVLLYRFFVIGGTPFQSSNFESISLWKFIQNFLLYIPISFIQADQFEILVTWLRSNFIYALFGWTIAFSLLYLIIRKLITLRGKQLKLFLFGIGWFIIFIIPACARFGQWYSFTASMGLIISALSLFRIDYRKPLHQAIMLIIIIAGIFSITVTAVRAGKWHNAANVAQTSLSNLKYTPGVKDTMIFLAVPDKIDRINTYKIGFTQAVWYYLNNRNIEVSPQLRIEMQKDTKITYKLITPSQIELTATNARFVPYGTISRAVIKDEKLSYRDGFQTIKITTEIKPQITTKAIVNILDSTLLNRIFIFNGKQFVRLRK
jgi:hypothetical protein